MPGQSTTVSWWWGACRRLLAALLLIGSQLASASPMAAVGSLLQQGYLDRAEAVAATLTPFERYYLQAEIALRRGDSERARARLAEAERVVETAGGDWPQWLELLAARIERLDRRPGLARSRLEALVSAASDRGGALLRAAWLQLAALLPVDEAQAVVTQLLEERRRAAEEWSPATLLELAHRLHRLGAGSARQSEALLRDLQQLTGSDRLLPEIVRLRASLYRQAGRLEEALRLLDEATLHANRLRQSFELLRIESARATLLVELQREEEALASFRRARRNLEPLRSDLPLRQPDGGSTYSNLVEPLLLGLAERLLNRSGQLAAAGDVDGQQRLLEETLQVVEALRLAELRDYFQDSCLAGQQEAVTSLDPGSAVLHLLMIGERVELLLGIGGQLHHRTVVVARSRVEQRVARLAYTLRPAHDGSLRPFARRPAADLYRWLIEPFAPLLERQPISTLVVVPDGALRQIPFAVLLDGDRHLIEHYAVAVVPGLTLLDAAPLAGGSVSLLLAGMSEPGPVVGELPDRLVSDLDSAGVVRGLRGMAIGRGGAEQQAERINPPQPVGPEQLALRNATLRDLLALPGVDQELAELGETANSRVLLNERFQLEPFSEEVGSNPYRVVHIASHGFFSGRPEESFVMTYDRLLDMDGLEALMKGRGLGGEPIELLALSACQTAEGDQRSPLGLSGVALKAGVRSAIGSLWSVSDQATRRLFVRFYRQLASDPASGKAAALREAQLTLLADPDYSHPFFWGPFILVGNWQ